MREFIYFSRSAVTTGNFKDLMKAGRIDIVCHIVINAFFLSHQIRDDVKLHLIFYGPPDPPRHIILDINKIKAGEINISKKDVSGLIKRILFKYNNRKRGLQEVFPGCFIEKKNLFDSVSKLNQERYILDKKGEEISKINFGENPSFILADHSGFPQKELKRLKKNCKSVSVGSVVYFASQVVTIVNHELDKQKI